jgi:hypothetical protein
MVEVEQPTETRLASYRAKRYVVVARYCLGHDDVLAGKPDDQFADLGPLARPAGSKEL